MIIDTDEKTVKFKAGETVDLPTLWGLIDLLDPDLVYIMTEGEQDPNAGRLDIQPKKIYSTRSDAKSYYYATVEFEDGTWACSCLDWIHRRAEDGGLCKHGMRHYFWRESEFGLAGH